MSSLGTLTIDLIAKTAQYTEGLNRAARQTERNTREMQRSLQQLEAQAEATRLAFKSTIAGFLSFQGAKSLIDIGDNYKAMAERVKMATNNLEEYDYVQQRLLKSTETSFRSLAEAQELFIATSDNLRGGYGYSLKESLDITDSLSFAFVRNATAADKAASAINAYDKALSKGKVSADEWQSISGAAGTIAQNIADAVGKTAQEIDRLGHSGKLAIEQLNEGLKKSKQDNEDAANSMVNTVNDALTIMSNKFQAFWGEFNRETGITSGVANSIIFLSDHLKYAEGMILSLSAVIVGKLSGALAGSAIATGRSALAFSAATIEANRYQVALARMSGMSAAAAKSQVALGVATRGASAAMGLLGGPAGLITIAAMGLVYFAGSAERAFDETIKLSNSFLGLKEDLESLTTAQAQNELLNLQKRYQEIAVEQAKLMDRKSELENQLEKMEARKQASLKRGGKGFSDLDKTNFKKISNELISINAQTDTLQKTLGKLFELETDLIQVKNGSYSKQSSVITEKELTLAGKALEYYENINKQIFMLKHTGSDAELLYQRQYGYLKDIEDVEYQRLLLRQREYDTELLLANNQKDLNAILTETKEKYDNIGKSVKEITLARAIDKGATEEQIQDLTKWLTAISSAPKSGGKTALNYFDDKLKSINEEIYKMKSLNEGLRLFGGESQYTAVSDLTREFNNQHSVLAKISAQQRDVLMMQAQELDNQKQINAIMTLSHDYANNFEDMYFELSLIGQTKQAIEELTFAREMEKRVKELSIGMSPENLEAMQKEMSKIMALRDEYNALKNAIDNNPMAGINEGFKRYFDDAGTVRDQWADATQTAFNGMSDAFSRFASGTKVDFRQMTVSILQDLSQILIKAAIVNSLKNASAAGGFWGSVASAFGYSGGGYTGAGGVHEPAGIVHKGEVVFSQRDIAKFGGVAAVERMRLRGYSNGGIVGGSVVNQNYHQNSNQPQPISIVVNVAEDGSTEVIDNSAGKALDRQIEVIVKRVIARESRPGGGLAKR
ncbi:hypothetical protein B9T11_07810 [Wohlfahrtiimonas chitiniclastica]|uniref:tape measure protein n=1 Tax=Wohlfahrtiimonas chitiniclastica TaxID=400946 RepID=UPI000B98F54E|nr:tape measure protein [Wohlfahrtiimonas chitiniclastica]OYQ79133.1 hypothetical protein B9T11_07810 [Wohlfahrtiimonas chitiniclastica]